MHSYNQEYQYEYIDTQEKLSALCKQYSKLEVLSIDTEFVRTQTLKPILGLIQVFDKKNVALIDPIAIQDLSLFAELLENPNIVKVMHSCSEDIETFWHHLRVLPYPVFDTQVAAGFLEIGVSIGYANLIEKLFSIEIDKGESRTDWIQRPLTPAQCAYASADVTHLMAIYEDLQAQIESRKQTQWIYDEIQLLCRKKSQEFPSEFAYLQFKNNWKLSKKSLYALKLLAQWRLNTARVEDKSVNFVLKEAAIFELANLLPTNNQALFSCHNLYSKQARLYGDDILRICNEAKSSDDALYPAKIQRLIEFTGYKGCAAAIKLLIESIAESHNIPATMMASKKQINQLLSWCWFDIDETECAGLRPDLLQGWRGILMAPSFQDTSSLRKLLEQNHEIKRSLQIQT